MNQNLSLNLILISLASLNLTGCFSTPSAKSAHSPSAASKSETSQPPFVEAYLEYIGPPEKWAGPQTVLVHVVALEQEVAEVLVSPNHLATEIAGIREGGRGLASDSTQHVQATMAREELGLLAKSLQDKDENFAGCAYPVRARLIRSDGTVLEKQGCRTQNGWPGVVSKTVSHFIYAAYVNSHEPSRQISSSDEPKPVSGLSRH